MRTEIDDTNTSICYQIIGTETEPVFFHYSNIYWKNIILGFTPDDVEEAVHRHYRNYAREANQRTEQKLRQPPKSLTRRILDRLMVGLTKQSRVKPVDIVAQWLDEDLDIVRLLLKHGADPNIVVENGFFWNGFSALAIARQWGVPKPIREALRSAGAIDISKEDTHQVDL